MAANKSFPQSGYILSLLRAVIGLTLYVSWCAKAVWDVRRNGRTWSKSSGVFAHLVAGVLEFFGGLLILFGLFTRPVAFILCGEMAVAYFRSHAPRGFWPIRNGGELAVLYCFIFLYLFAAGGGPISLDRFLRKRGYAPFPAAKRFKLLQVIQIMPGHRVDQRLKRHLSTLRMRDTFRKCIGRESLQQRYIPIA